MPRDVYGRFFRSVLFPTWEGTVRRRPTLSRLAYLERMQWRSKDELEATQLGSLRRLLRHAYDNVPYYRQRWDAAGLSDRDVTTLEDLTKLPVLTREEARAHAAELASSAPPVIEVRKNTGGTTGQPLLFGYDLGSEHWRNAVRLRGYAWAGYRPGDRALFYWGAPVERPPPPARRAKIALDRFMKREHYFPCAVLDEEHMREVVRAIEEIGPRILVCYTQAGAELARFINREKLRSWMTLPVICGAERLVRGDRDDLELAFGPAVFETYGCREVMLIGAECEAHEGLHLSVENLVVEVLVHEGGKTRPARPGELGEVVITDLHNFGMPFIRYANGDMAVAGSGARCSCGRTLPRLESVEGRATDLLRDARGAAVTGIAFHVLFTGLAAAARQFQVVQHKDRSVTLRIVPGEGLDGATLTEVQQRVGEILQGVPVKIERVQEIAATSAGKRRTVVVEQ